MYEVQRREGVVTKLRAGKIYCPNCQKLVNGQDQREQEDSHKLRILCPICKQLLYTWDGIVWRYHGRVAVAKR